MQVWLRTGLGEMTVDKFPPVTPGILYSFPNASTGYSEQIDKESALNILVVSEIYPSEAFFLQASLGTFINLWFYSYEYDNPDYISSYTYSEYSGTHANFGLMLAGGTAFHITDNVSVPMYLRADIMVRYGIMIPVTANSGIRISF